MSISLEDLAAATRLTRAGRLVEATRAIQAALKRKTRPATSAPTARTTAAPGTRPVAEQQLDVVSDVAFREIARPADTADTGEAVLDRRPAPAPASAPEHAPTGDGAFTSSHFQFGADRYRFRMFRPATPPDVLLPVVVMLHGCKQNAEDFARGTGMNALGQRQQAIVLYPEQLRKGNSMGCWNWFEPAHQRRDAGEPAMIASLVQHVAAKHGGDPDRIYVAGLSAGAAMAALLGELYPDVFAAVGIHSGLPVGAANDVSSAFGAMRRGATTGRASRAVPTIVMHGTGDKTVTHRNADAIVQGQLAAWSAAGVPLARDADQKLAGGRAAARSTWVDAQGRIRLETWSIAGGPHAWSGGDAGGSFTDPVGPSASEAMLAFFLEQRRAA